MTDKTLVPDPAAPKPTAPVPAAPEPGFEDAPIGASAFNSAGALLTPGAVTSVPTPKVDSPDKSATHAVPRERPAPPAKPVVPPVGPGSAGAPPVHGRDPAGTPSPPPPPASPPPHPPARSGNFAWLVILLVVLCVGLGAAIWYQRQQSEATGMTVASRIDGLSNELNEARRDMREALSLAQSQTAKITALENAVRENQAEYSTLEQAWQDFNDTTNDGVLANDVERLLTIASQQLRLGGSVSNAIVALESAQSRLTRADRPHFVNLQQAVNGDLDRLRAVPVVDVAAQSARIERLSVLVSKAPLLVPDAQSMLQKSSNAEPAAAPQPEAPVVRAAAPDAPWWQHWRAEVTSWPARAGSALTHELGDLIKVQRVDQPGSLMMSASQAEQLRATLRQRLQTVQLALLIRQASVWKNELAIVADTLNNYYEPRATDTQAALRLAESLGETPVAVALPDIVDSLNAMAAVRSQASPETGQN